MKDLIELKKRTESDLDEFAKEYEIACVDGDRDEINKVARSMAITYCMYRHLDNVIRMKEEEGRGGL